MGHSVGHSDCPEDKNTGKEKYIVSLKKQIFHPSFSMALSSGPLASPARRLGFHTGHRFHFLDDNEMVFP